jgi:long-chain acyl-CoA synthetase
LIAVPAIYEKIKHGIMNRINKAGAVKKALFNLAYKAKMDAMRAGTDTPFWNKLVFNTLKENVGGRMRLMITGSAPLSSEVHDFVRVCFGAPLLQGYGLTETVSCGTVQHVQDMSFGRIGGSVPPCELKLVDCPDMGYTHKDSEGPRGEIWIRGPTVALGYYKQEDKTREAFIDGWFATGDIGKVHPDGSFQIIDRKKHLIKPPHGEYIALEKLESVYRNCPYLESLCVYVDSSHYHCVCLAVPNRDLLTEWAQKNGKNVDDFNSLCKSVDVRKFILHELQGVGRKFGLKSIETIRAIRLYPELWTPQNKFLTAAMKLNRTHVTDVLRNDIKDMYAEIVE